MEQLTRKEWYERRSLARRILTGWHSTCCSPNHDKQPMYRFGSNTIWDAVDQLHEYMKETLYSHGQPYDIIDNKWAIGHNHKAFDRKQPIRASKMKWRAYD